MAGGAVVAKDEIGVCAWLGTGCAVAFKNAGACVSGGRGRIFPERSAGFLRILGMRNSSSRSEKIAKAHQASFQAAKVGCERFARRFQEVRERAKLSLYALEQASGVSRVMIDRIERGKSHPTIFLLMRLAFALGVGLAELMEE